MVWSVDPQVTVHGDRVSAVVRQMKLMCLTIIGLLLASSRTQIVPMATFKLHHSKRGRREVRRQGIKVLRRVASEAFSRSRGWEPVTRRLMPEVAEAQ